jgi:hypothetical protein
MAISIKSAKAKARRLQNYCRDTLRALFPDLSANDIQSAIMGERGEDIVLSDKAKARLGISVEAKARGKLAITEWYCQCQRNSEGREAVLVVKADGRKELAVVNADHYFALLAHALNNSSDA